MLFQLKVLVLHVSHCDDESALVGFISNSDLGVTGQVKTVNLVEESEELVFRQTVVNRHDAHTSLFEELDVGTGNVTWHVVNSTSDLIVALVQIATKGLRENANDGSHGVVSLLEVPSLLMLGNHVFVFRLLDPSFLEVSGASEEGVLLGKNALNVAHSSEQGCSAQ